MGLKKETPTQQGVVGEYWKVTEFTYFAPGKLAGTPRAFRGLDTAAPVAIARLGLFVDKSTADADAAPLTVRRIYLEADLSGSNLVKQIYEHIKANEEDLADAEDVLEEE